MYGNNLGPFEHIGVNKLLEKSKYLELWEPIKKCNLSLKIYTNREDQLYTRLTTG